LVLSRRKKEILREVIETFILTGEPVSSKAIVGKLHPPCSSATVRNEMNDLEKAGYLEHLHTSAGRIPTSRGYRIYINSLMEDYRLSFEETLILNSLLSDTVRESDRILEDTTSLLAKMTGYAVIAFAKESFGTIERFQGVFINNHSLLLVMITASGKAVTKQLQVSFPLSPEGVDFIIAVLNDHLAKKELGSITLERMIAMEQELGEYRSLIGPLIRIIYDVMAQLGKESVYIKGLSNLFSYSEFQDEKKVVDVLRELEDNPKLLERFRQEESSGIRVHIATGGEGLNDASFVLCPFRLGRGLSGTVCILGPKRMDYGKAMARLEYLAKQINAVHGFEPLLPLIEETKEK